MVRPGTVLLSFKLSIGKVGISAVPLYTNEAIAALPIKDEQKVDSRYLLRALEAMRLADGANRAAMGATLNKKSLAKVRVPVPSLPEQRRIAAILDQADAIRAKRRAALNQLVELEQSIFYEMFPPAASFPMEPIGDLGLVTTGKTPSTALDGMFGGTVPFVTPGDLGSQKEVARTLSEAGAAASRVVRAGATFVCCIGATIGKVAPALERSAFNQQINAVEWRENIDDAYGLAIMRNSKSVIVARGASTTLPLLPKSQFAMIKIPVPPIASQRSFAARVALVDTQRAAVRRALASDDELFASLQSRAFRREL